MNGFILKTKSLVEGLHADKTWIAKGNIIADGSLSVIFTDSVVDQLSVFMAAKPCNRFTRPLNLAAMSDLCSELTNSRDSAFTGGL